MMTKIRRLIRLLTFITTTILTLLYLNRQSIWFAIPVMILGILWYRLGISHMAISHVGFLLICILVALDVFENGISLWAIFAIHSALAQWDLLTYLCRQQSMEIPTDLAAIEQRHLYRLGYVIVIGIILSLVTLYFQTNIPLLGIIICGLVVMIALSRTIIRLRRDSA